MFTTANLCVNGGGLMTRPGLSDRDFLRPGVPGTAGPVTGPLGATGPGLMHSPFPFLTDGYMIPPRSTPGGLIPHNPLPPISTLALPCSVAVTSTNPAGPGLPGLTVPTTAAHFPGPNPALMTMAVNHQQALEQAFLQELALHAQGFGAYGFGKKLFSCPQCRYITDRKNNLKRHIATMHQECDKALECCGVTFKNKASLRDHVLIFHSNGYMCRFCGRNFCRKALLKRHLTVHSGQKDYTCGLCDYATSHKSNLERHKKVHERPEGEMDPSEGHNDDINEMSSSNPGLEVTSPDDIIDVLTMDEDDQQLSAASSSSASSHGSLSDKEEWSEE